MRFDRLKIFSIEELSLDEGNYRFKKAEDQRECIRKIYDANQGYFKNLMRSIAEDDLGEPILVYEEPASGHNIVMDGNRRTAALKVLNDPDYAPTPAIAQLAHKLGVNMTPSALKIQAQVSSHKDLIYKTVYERHASGKGRSRINWAALAAARFRFDRAMTDDKKDWQPIALVFEVEAADSGAEEFLNSEKYSHEVFRRVVNAAIRKKIISENIFSSSLRKIKRSEKRLLADAIQKCLVILESMKKGELSLSRGRHYADQRRVDEYLDGFDLAPGVPRRQGGGLKDGAANNVAGEGDQSGSHTPVGNKPHDENGQYGGGDEDVIDDAGDGGASGPTGYSTRISRSKKIEKELSIYGNAKISELYTSLWKISLKQHPSLMMAGAWVFFECLTKAAGKKDGTQLHAFVNNKVSKAGSWNIRAEDVSEVRASAEYISHVGDLVKHGSRFTLPDAVHLSQSFKILEDVILLCIKDAIEAKGERK